MAGGGEKVNLVWISMEPTKAMDTTDIMEQEKPQVHTAKQL